MRILVSIGFEEIKNFNKSKLKFLIYLINPPRDIRKKKKKKKRVDD